MGEPTRAADFLRQSLAEGLVFGSGVHRSFAALGLRDERAIRELLRPRD